MTLLLNFRTHAVAGSVTEPVLYDFDMPGGTPQYRLVPREEWDDRVRGRDALFATHGFNVNGPDGAGALARFGEQLGLGASDLYIAMIWPGDWWLPAVNYPFEGDTARKCGRLLAEWCQDRLQEAASVSFLSHSLGARLVLEAVQNSNLHPRMICMMAGAINRDCLDAEYTDVRDRTETIAVLASRCDEVLALAFPTGDLVADIIDPDHAPFTAALGRNGPSRPIRDKLQRPWQIGKSEDFGHGDYLPQARPAAGAVAKWEQAAGFAARAWKGAVQTWPV